MDFLDSRILFFLAAFFMIACQGQQRKDNKDSAKEKNLTNNPERGEELEADFVGIYSQGPGYQEFKSCKDWKIYGIAEKTQLAAEYNRLGLASGEPLFVRINGSIRQDQQQNPILEVERIVQATEYKGQEDCPIFNNRTFVFRGNEPFWSLTINDENVTFNHFERDSVVFDFQSPTWQDSAWVLNAKTENQSLTAYIAETECIDSMSGIRYDMSVQVETAGEVYRGCGGWDARENKPGP